MRRTWKNKSRGNGGWNVDGVIYANVKKEKPPELQLNSVYLVNGHEMKYVGRVGILHQFLAVNGGWTTTLSELQLDNIREV